MVAAIDTVMQLMYLCQVNTISQFLVTFDTDLIMIIHKFLLMDSNESLIRCSVHMPTNLQSISEGFQQMSKGKTCILSPDTHGHDHTSWMQLVMGESCVLKCFKDMITRLFKDLCKLLG